MLLMTGDPTAAMTPLEEAVEYARKAETQLMMPVAQGFFGAACTAAGRWTDGIRHLSAAVRDADAMGFMFQQPLRLALLAEAHLAAGQETEAALQAEAARSLAERQGARGALAQALTIEARLAARRGGDGAQALWPAPCRCRPHACARWRRISRGRRRRELRGEGGQGILPRSLPPGPGCLARSMAAGPRPKGGRGLAAISRAASSGSRCGGRGCLLPGGRPPAHTANLWLPSA